MRVLYIDVLFLNNAVINTFLLTVCAFLCGIRINMFRIICGAAVGALYCACAYLPDMGGLAFFPLFLTVSFIMTGISYGVWEWVRLIKYTAMFFLCSFILAGVLFYGCIISGAECFYINGAVYYDIPGLMLVLGMLTSAVVGGSAIMCAVKRRSMKDFYKKVNLTVCGKTICITGFADSGNNLYEPMTSLPVSVISIKTAKKLFGENNLKKIFSFSHGEIKVYPVFCRSVTGSGVMPSFIPDEFTADGVNIHGMIAVSADFSDSRCEILLNADNIREEQNNDFKIYSTNVQTDSK